ncbi:hypothetical protein AHF37_10103 [Paragonimus kellicotti]|nr:hypothetical protein AHF37_10103 [Paragonimus kellicotti]
MGSVQFLVIATPLYMILYSYFCAIFVGPGCVPLSWDPSDPQARKHLQFCRICNGYKPPRAHHCRTCGRCIMKMDHHCPWINACCGHLNHGYFLHFIHWAPIGCTVCAIMLAFAVYHDWKSVSCHVVHLKCVTRLPRICPLLPYFLPDFMLALNHLDMQLAAQPDVSLVPSGTS